MSEMNKLDEMTVPETTVAETTVSETTGPTEPTEPEIKRSIADMHIFATVSVVPGNGVFVPIPQNREYMLTVANGLVIDGFNKLKYKLVVPQTPFKPGTTTRWADKGAHVTVALNSVEHPTTENIFDAINLELIELKFKNEYKLLWGQESNATSTGCVGYVVLEVDDDTVVRINLLRAKIGLPVCSPSHLFHVSIAGFAPIDENYQQMYDDYMPPRPTTGMPLPFTKLTLNVNS